MIQGPLRVLRVIARLNVGGPARHTVILDEGLRDRGFETMIVYGAVAEHEGSLERLVHERSLPSRYVPTLGRRISVFEDLRAFVAIVRIVRWWRPDVIHTHTAKAGTLGRIAAALHNATLPRRRRALIVHTFHGHVFTGYFGRVGSLLVRVAERVLALLTDTIVAISPAQRVDLSERFGIARPEKVRVVPLGLELQPLLAVPRSCRGIRDELGLPTAAITVGFVGRLVPVKDPATLVRAVAEAGKTIPELHLLVAGDGELRESMSELARQSGIAERVHLLGWRDDLPSLYAAMDVFVLTSVNEGTPVALIEAMAAGVPVIATRVGGVPDVIEDGVSGVLVPPGDPAAIARAIAGVVGDPQRADRMADAARALVATRHGAARLVRDIDVLYREQLMAKRFPRERGEHHGTRS